MYFDLLVFKVFLESFGALFSKWHVTRKGLAVWTKWSEIGDSGVAVTHIRGTLDLVSVQEGQLRDLSVYLSLPIARGYFGSFSALVAPDKVSYLLLLSKPMGLFFKILIGFVTSARHPRSNRSLKSFG